MSYIVFNPRTNDLLIVHPYGTDRKGYFHVEGSHGHNYDLPMFYYSRLLYIGELD